MKTYIDEQKADSLQQAAVLADDYSLTYHGSFEMSDSSQTKLSHSDANHRNIPFSDPKSAGNAEDFREHCEEALLEDQFVTTANGEVM